MRTYFFVVKWDDGRREFAQVDARSIEEASARAKHIWCGWDEVVCTGSKGEPETALIFG